MPIARVLSRVPSRRSVTYVTTASLFLSLGCHALGLDEPTGSRNHPSVNGTWEARTTIVCGEAPAPRPGTIRLVLANDGRPVAATRRSIDGVVQKLTGTWQTTQCSGDMGAPSQLRNGEYFQADFGFGSLNDVSFYVYPIALDPATLVYEQVFFEDGLPDRAPTMAWTMTARLTTSARRRPGDTLSIAKTEAVFTRAR